MLEDARAGDPNSWASIVRLYAPLVLWWCRQGFPRCERLPGLGKVPGQDEQDVVQEVFLTVFNRIADFTKDRKPAAFRRWLYAITRYKVLEYWHPHTCPAHGRGGSGIWVADIPEPGPPPNGPGEGAEDSVPVRVLLLRRLLDLVRREFEPDTWEAFWGVAAEGHSAKDVAERLDMKVGAVYTAKSRVLKRLRQEAEVLGLYFPEGNVVTDDVAVAAQPEVTS
jgi:RNA polymerase sigma-70 factor (ECF subfamily)